MTKTELAYLAGIIDGEGTLGASLYRKKTGWCRTYLSISNTSENLMHYIHDLIGEGSVYCWKAKKLNHKPSYQFVIRGYGLRRLLPQIQEFLVLKVKQGVLVRELLKLTDRQSPDYVYKDATRLGRQTEIVKELHLLNQKGNIKNS